jgi:hypothetical protein
MFQFFLDLTGRLHLAVMASTVVDQALAIASVVFLLDIHHVRVATWKTSGGLPLQGTLTIPVIFPLRQHWCM